MRTLQIENSNGTRYSVTIHCGVHTNTIIERVLSRVDSLGRVIIIENYGTYRKCSICGHYIKITLDQISDSVYCTNCHSFRLSRDNPPVIICLSSYNIEIHSRPDSIDEVDDDADEIIWLVPRGHIAYTHCPYCGESWTRWDLCASCQERAVQCERCQEYVNRDDAEFDSNDNPLCPSCARAWWRCEDCGCWTDYGNCCEDCEQEYHRHIHEHDYKPYPKFHPENNGDSALFLGIELETDKYENDIDEVAEELLQHSQNETLFYLGEDGTLENGIEIISHPCTLNYHKTTLPWLKIIETVGANGGSSHNAGTCGLHIHFNTRYLGNRDSEENDFNLLKLIYIFEKLWDKLIVFSRRRDCDLHWAKKYNQLNGKESEDVGKVKAWKGGYGDKYMAVNVVNRSTVEIRLFRGTLKLSTFYASLEFVDFLVNFVKNHNARYIYKLTWEQLIDNVAKKEKQYPYLIPYLKERQLCA